ncbi:MAG: DUF4340 domain-containing protein [Acidobacteriia bacterium]|nr:DUF4340 domain-containing protein [Terriglobia bacterium]
MKWRNLIIGVVVLAVLGAFVYFYEFRGEGKREAARQRAEKIFDIKDDAIISLLIQRGSEKTVIEQQNGRWVIKSPVSATADQTALNEIVRNLSSATSTRSLTGAQNLSEYGLQPPKIHAEFKTRPGNSFTMDVGEKDFSENNVYARASSRADVVLVSSYLFSSLDKSLMQLRDRKIAEVDPEKITQIDYVSKGEHLTAQKLGAEWKLTQPVAARGDATGISSYLNDASSSEASEFLDKPEATLKSFELDPPVGTLTLTEGEGAQSKQKKLLLGARKDDQVYAMLEGSPAIFKITTIVSDKIRPVLFKLRDKQIVTLKAADVQHVLIQLENDVYEFDRENSKDSNWKVVLPKKQAGKQAREWKFWFPLEDMKAEEILDPPASLEKAALFFKSLVHVTLVDRSNHQSEIRFSKPEKGSVWIRSSRTVYRVSSKTVQDWTSGLKDVVE